VDVKNRNGGTPKGPSKVNVAVIILYAKVGKVRYSNDGTRITRICERIN